MKMLRNILIAAGLLIAGPLHAQTVVVASCGAALSAPYTAGNIGRAFVIDVNGNLCFIGTTTTAQSLGITPTDRTITSATGASQTVSAANASRHGLIIQNTGTANCGINPTGGTAAIGGAGTLTLVPNGSYQPRIPTLSAITAICTAGQPLYAEEN